MNIENLNAVLTKAVAGLEIDKIRTLYANATRLGAPDDFLNPISYALGKVHADLQSGIARPDFDWIALRVKEGDWIEEPSASRAFIARYSLCGRNNSLECPITGDIRSPHGWGITGVRGLFHNDECLRARYTEVYGPRASDKAA